MTDFADLAHRALPCPFCGERLVLQTDHHGEWLAHRSEPGRCVASTTQLFSEDDLTDWNTREAAAALTDDQLRNRLFAISKPSLREWCRVHDVNSAHANEFATGVRGPGSDLLKALGLQRAWVPAPDAHATP